MKNTLLVFCLGVSILGCQGIKEVKIGPLSGPETKTVSEYSSGIENALLAMRGEELFESRDVKLNKATSEWLNDCAYTTKHDARNRSSGRTVDGRSCPFNADWDVLIQGPNSEAIVISYLQRIDSFSDQIPLTRFSIKGQRNTDIESGEFTTTTTYHGESVNQFGDKANFTATRREFAVTSGLAIKEMVYTYDITVQIGDTKVSGRINDKGEYFVGGAKITSEEFQTLFFELK